MATTLFSFRVSTEFSRSNREAQVVVHVACFFGFKMIFKTLALWGTSDPTDALGRIDRALDDRNHRLSAGLSVSERFDNVLGALVVAQGNGKYLRIRHVVSAAKAIPPTVRAGCQDVVRGALKDVGQIRQLIADLAEPQANVVEQLKCEAGKYVDRVLAVAVTDPGIWNVDFDGKKSYFPMCDATRLAELSGVTVIDSFPDRDLAIGGRGSCLEALPCWILFADRDPRIANQTRGLVSIGSQSSGYYLPPSDGLDSEVPKVRTYNTLGFGFLNDVISQCIPAHRDFSKMDRIYAAGLPAPMLRQQWESARKEMLNTSANTVDMANRLTAVAKEYLKENPGELSNLVHSGIQWVVDLNVENLSAQGQQIPELLLVSCPAQFETNVINQFSDKLIDSKVVPTRQAGVDHDELDPVVAAVLGLFHIDQMPANVPGLTGANCQRILGRLTPGRPSNWRQLVRVMADFHPAPMKLADAI